MKASIFFTSSPVSQLVLPATALRRSRRPAQGSRSPPPGMYSSGVAIHPRLRDVQPLLLGRDRRPADAYRAGQGVRRDYAHLAITFCPAMNILARYVVGYIP
jgi:hypothetical protein